MSMTAFLRLTGGTRESVIGRTTTELRLWQGPLGRAPMVQTLRRDGQVRDLSHSMRTPTGETLELSVSATVLKVDGEELILVIARDITERRHAEARIAHLAHHDALTGLANRVMFQTRLEQEVGTGRRFGLVCLDLDRFKEVNDTYGHPIGDALLQQVGARLAACVREDDTVARLGGDEFAIIQHSARQPAGVLALADRIVRRLARPFVVEGREIVVRASLGVATAPRDGDVPDTLLRAADLALYRSKSTAPGGWSRFEPAIERELATRSRLELELRRAVAAEEFELFFQPLVDLGRRCYAGCEALLRWRHPIRGLVGAHEFIQLAEQTGLIGPIGEWALRRACAEAVGWPDGLKVAVNISPVQLRRRELVEEVRSALLASGLEPGAAGIGGDRVGGPPGYRGGQGDAGPAEGDGGLARAR